MGLCSVYSVERLQLFSGTGTEPPRDFTWLTADDSEHAGKKRFDAFVVLQRERQREAEYSYSVTCLLGLI